MASSAAAVTSTTMLASRMNLPNAGTTINDVRDWLVRPARDYFPSGGRAYEMCRKGRYVASQAVRWSTLTVATQNTR